MFEKLDRHHDVMAEASERRGNFIMEKTGRQASHLSHVGSMLNLRHDEVDKRDKEQFEKVVVNGTRKIDQTEKQRQFVKEVIQYKAEQNDLHVADLK